jgi:uncharacterized protein (DUF58 family)
MRGKYIGLVLRIIVWLAAALLCLGAWAYVGSNASLAVLIAVILLPIASLLLTFLAARSVSVRLFLPAAPQKSAVASCGLEVKNASILPLARVRTELAVVNQLTGEESSLPVECSVSPRSTKRVDFDFDTDYCGRFRFSSAETRVYDFFGLAGSGKKVSLREKRTVLPETFPMVITLSGSETPLGDDVLNLNKKGSDYSEPFQIRDYVEGDSVKQIHWKLSSKFDKYIVTDPSVALERALLVFWDKSVSAAPAVADTLAEAVMSFCLSLAEQEIPYSLALGGGESPIKDITATEDLEGAVHQLLKSQEQGDGIPELLQMIGGRHYPMIALFTPQVTKEIRELAAIGSVTVFLCSETGEGESVGDLNSYVFSPADYKTALRDVTV